MLAMRLSDYINFFFSREKTFCRDLQQILGFMPHHLDIYHEALLHGSVHYQKGDCSGKNNERLEFLGDAVLGSVVSDILYRNYPKRHEGFLTKARSMMVRRETLNQIAHEIGLDKLIQTALNQQKMTHNCSVSGNAFEAFVGAVYLDRGYKYAYRFIQKRVFSKQFNMENLASKETNYKSRIIEWCQKYHYDFSFVLDNEENTSEGILFHSSIIICGVTAGKGKGYTKKESHQQAAHEAILNIANNHQILNEIRTAALAQEEAETHEDFPEVAEEEENLTFEETAENTTLIDTTETKNLKETTKDIDLKETTEDIDLKEKSGDLDLKEKSGDFALKDDIGDTLRESLGEA